MSARRTIAVTPRTAPSGTASTEAGSQDIWPVLEKKTLGVWIDEVLSTIPAAMAMLSHHPLEQARAALLKVVSARALDSESLDLFSVASCAVLALADVQHRIDGILQHLSMQEATLRFAVSPEARTRLILETSRLLGATRRQLRQDRRALRRWFDWPAVRERAEHTVQRLIRCQQSLVLIAGRLHRFVDPGSFATMAAVTGFFEWSLECLSREVAPCLERELTAAWALLLVERAIDSKEPEIEDLAVALRQRATNAHADVWVQVNALKGWLGIDLEEATAAIHWRFQRGAAEPEHNLFFRRCVLEEVVGDLEPAAALRLIETCIASRDGSSHVRQGAVLALRARQDAGGLRVVQKVVVPALEKEDVAQVRAAYAVLLATWLRTTGTTEVSAEVLLDLWQAFFRLEQDAVVLQIAVSRLGDALEERLADSAAASGVAEALVADVLQVAVDQDWSLPVRRLVEDLHERITVASIPGFREFRRDVVGQLDARTIGSELRIDIEDGDLDDDTFGRFLAWAARRRDGLYAERSAGGWRVRLGTVRGFRWWRFIHETRRKAPDKRQSFDHLSGRKGFGTVRAHSAILAEESPTKVPGEPVRIHEEGGWRRFLPPLDDFLDCVLGVPIVVYSSQGRVRLVPPESWRGRLSAWLTLTRSYAKFATLREESQLCDPEVAANSYIESLRDIGFGVEWYPYLPTACCTASPYFAVTPSRKEEAAC